jgi:lipopolysaccharide/colanic/teichoic acid biosynthesis glycosyltransferase
MKRYDRTKRILDVAIAAAVLVASAPVQLAVAVAIVSTMGRPVLFRQVRPGLGGRLFELVKFRTMHEVDEERRLVSDAERLTRVGRFLRATSLDELPTLRNVLGGEMSLVGPRPLLVRYLDRYTSTQGRRHEVRPGVTGLAQVHGRNALSWEDKLALDVWYVDHRCLALDCRILLETVRTVLRREGISAEGAATATEFTGSR